MKFNVKRTLLCSLVFGWISLFWGSYDAIMQSINYDVFELNSVWHGVILAADNIIGLFLLPFFGKMSDKTTSKFGKRTPYIALGTLMQCAGFTGVCIFASLGKDYFVYFILCLIVTLASLAAYRSPGLAIVPDINPDAFRSKANAVSNIISVLFTVLAMLYFYIFMQFKGYYAIGLSMVVTTLIMLIVYMIFVKENKFCSDMRKEADEAQKKASDAAELMKKNNELTSGKEYESEKNAYSLSHSLDVLSFKEDTLLHLPSIDSALRHENYKEKLNALRKHDDESDSRILRELRKQERRRTATNKILILVIVFCFYMAYNALTSNFIKYAEYILNFKQNEAIIPLILAQLAAMLAFPAASWFASKIGRKTTIFIGFLIIVTSFIATAFFTTPSPVLYVIFALLGVGFGFVMVNIYPFFLELSPSGQIGVNTGYFAVSMTVAMVITPILSGLLITEAAGWFGGGENAGFRVLFPYSAIFLVLATLITLFIKKTGGSRKGA